MEILESSSPDDMPPPRVAQRATPAPFRSQVLVDVLASSMNPIDVKRAGGYGLRLLSLKGAGTFVLDGPRRSWCEATSQRHHLRGHGPRARYHWEPFRPDFAVLHLMTDCVKAGVLSVAAGGACSVADAAAGFSHVLERRPSRAFPLP